MSGTPLRPEVGYLLRDILNLPERDRVKVFETLREDLGEAAAPSKIDEINEKMANAIETFNRVADHLGYDNGLAKLSMTMREFNEAPTRVRDGVQARHIAGAFFGSWPLALQAAIGESIEPRPTQTKLRQRLSTQRLRVERMSAGLYEWLDTKPENKARDSYDQWKLKRNRQLDDDQRPFASARHIAQVYGRPWREIVAEAETGKLGLPHFEHDEDPLASQRTPTDAPEDPALEAEPSEPPSPSEYSFDAHLLARRVRQALDDKAWNRQELERRTGIPRPTVQGIEDGGTAQGVTFATVVRLAAAFEVPLDWFLTPDGKSGLPPRRGRTQSTKERRARARARQKGRG